MVYSLRKILIGLITLFVISTGLTSTAYGEATFLSGVGVYKELSEEYYYGAVYSDFDGADADTLLSSVTEKKLVLRIAASHITPRRFYKLWSQALAINNSIEDIQKYDSEMVAFATVTRGRLKRGDEIIIETTDNDFLVTINGVEALRHDQPGFINVLLNGWIGPHPPLQSFKRDVLGQSADQTFTHLAEFDALKPQEDRIALIQDWYAPIEAELTETTEAAALATTEGAEASVSASALNQTETSQENTNTATEDKQTQEQLAQQAAEAAKAKEEAHAARRVALQQLIKERERLRGIQVETSKYMRRLVAHANLYTVYPKRAIKRNRQGEVLVKIQLNSKGEVVDSFLIEEARYSELNKAALKAVKKAQPFPQMPEAMDSETFEISIPFRFALIQEQSSSSWR